ncbi:hypothetical protein FPQ18DRAFT_325591 [Pyronema domesticum]|uniref:Similar to RNA and export factor-binding protein 2 acc. no. Q9JJW6 n=1 Tax=Pyronema omphalodes (strain CBS 100304) TaxID=1076935 RepID=U4LLA8_PYROM|nr:hypothetical protein FPQ18DRAFT_325591 [Pyronema domesticum]CCX32347.1 Similar to RNA and export factor-binding protein 2; acc. no. Q9JJW6 [Pyronema omphalodes CBS 100304]
MDKALDDAVRERHNNGRNNRNNQQRRGTPRGGVRKPGRNTNGSYDDSRLWVHDKFNDGDSNDRSRKPMARDFPIKGMAPSTGAKVKVENIHYELGEEELMDLFRRQGPVVKLDLLYDRAGRSEGTAFVTYAHEADALSAIKAYDGANANGQPITLTLVARDRVERGPSSVNSAQSRPRSLFDRIVPQDGPGGPRERRRSLDDRRDPTRKPTPPGIDRYVPPERRRERERGGGERTQAGPRPAVGHRDGGRGQGRRGGPGGHGGPGGNGERGGRGGNMGRPKKTVEELDAEMNDYFAESADAAAAPAVAPPAQAAAVDEDEDMIL